MPSIPKDYIYSASTQYKLFQQIADDHNIKWFSPYGSYKKSRRSEVKAIILKILKILTGGDVLSFVNDVLTPMDIAQHIHPADKVCFFYIYEHCQSILNYRKS